MKLKRIVYACLLAAGCLNASAQATTATEDAFNAHWYVQAQGGAQYNVGEVKFGKLLTPNVQLAGGYQFTPIWGLRLAVNGWQSKAGSNLTTGKYYWKWNYVSPTLDATLNLTNWIGGYKKRLVDVGLLAGLGANIAWDNDEANQVNADMRAAHGFPSGSDVAFLHYLWDDTKVRFTGRVGAFVDFHVTPRLDIGIEANANTLSDHYNSKRAENTDWYINGLVGVKVHLGKVTRKVAKTNPCGEIVVEKVVEKPVEKIVEKVVYRDREVEKAREPLRRDIFFGIRGSEVSKEEMTKVDDIIAYMKKYPESKVTVTAHADKGTGNARLNKMYSERRAKIIFDLLTKNGISADRITTVAKGDTEQPYEKNELNRVSICVAE